MRLSAVTSLFLIISCSIGKAEPLKLTDEQDAQLKQAAFALALADECNKRFDDPAIFKLATENIVEVFSKIGVPDARSAAETAAKELAEKPQQPTHGFSFTSREFCDGIKAKLTTKKND